VTRTAVRHAAACLAAGLLGVCSTASGAPWTSVSPGGGGAFTCVGAGPTGIILVGSDIGGAYRSDDGGATWKSIGYLNSGLTKSHISSVAFDPGDAQIVYLGGEDGLFRSSDAGQTFSLRLSGGIWSAVAVSPSDPYTVYAAKHSTYNSVDPQIYRSMDRGVNWALVGSLPPGSRVLKLAVRPNNPNQLFAVSGYDELMASTGQPRRALYVSSNGGTSWVDAHGDSMAQGMVGNAWDAAYDPARPDTIYATSVVSSGNPDVGAPWSGFTWRGSQAGGVWTMRSTHTGAIVLRRDLLGGQSHILTIDVSRDGPGCTECGVFDSRDAGASWTRVSDMSGWATGWIGSISWAYNQSTAGVCKTIGRDLTDRETLYWVTPQFVWRSRDWGVSFAGLFTDPASPGFWRGRGINNTAPAALSASGGVLYAGCYDLGIWRSLDLGTSWQSCNSATLTGTWNGRGGNCMTILADPARPNVVWASQGETMENSQVIRSSAGGAPASWTGAWGVPPGFISGLTLDPTSPVTNRTLYACANGDVYRSTDDGQSWNLVFNCDSCYITAAAGTAVFAGGQKGLWKSVNGGTTWSELSPGIFRLPLNGFLLKTAKWNGPHEILAQGARVFVAVVGKDRGLYRSLDGGSSWTRVLADDYAREIHVDVHGALYFASSSATSTGGIGGAGSTGVKISEDGGTTWSSLTSGLPWPFAWPIATIAAADNSVTLVVGSPGTGFWSTSIPAPTLSSDLHAGVGRLAAGFRPNPALGRVAVAYSLPSPDPAVLEVFDVAGRRLIRRELRGMGPGDHLLPLGPQFVPPPGIYVVRLVQGARSVSSTSVVVR
jgi:hypothetical protein